MGVGMATVGRWTGRETRSLREALRLTVRDFAEDLGVSPRTISKWEAGGSAHCPRPELQAALDTMLARATDEDRQRFQEAPRLNSSGPQRAEPERAPRPITLLQARNANSLSLSGGADLPYMRVGQLRQVTEMLDGARGRDEPELVPHFALCLEDCQTQDGNLGPLKALPSALSVIAAIEVTARQVSVAVRLQLLTLAARCAEFAGWLYRDAGALDQATYWYDRATEWAQEARNPAMQGYLLLRKSQLAYDARDALRVLTLAQAAQHGPWQLPVRVQAEVSLQHARGLGMLGHPRDTVQRQLDDAWTLLARAVPDDESSKLLGATFTEGTLRLRSASCYVEVGQTRLAADLAIKSAEVVVTASSQRTMRVLVEIVDVLAPWNDRPAVRTLREAIGA
jgi:transcriptional regulator with XRE-family HTH domain